MSDPTRLIDGSGSRMVVELLAAGQLEAPAPELVERFMRTAALGVITGVTVEPLVSTAAELVTSPAAGAGSATAGSATAGSAAAGAGGGVLVNGGAIGAGVMKGGATAAALVKSGTVVASLGKWGGMGVVALAAAVGTPRALDWVEHRGIDTAASAAARVDVLRTRQPAQRAPTEWAPAPSAAAALPRLDPVEPARIVEPGGVPRPERPERGASAEHATSKLQPASPSALPAVITPSRQPAKPASKPPSSPPARPESSAGVAPVAALPATASTLGAELASVDRARTVLARGDARQTLHELAGHERQYPKGQLQLEVTMLRMEACVQLGDLPAARDLAKRILAQPVSPLHASRARQVLEGQRSPR